MDIKRVAFETKPVAAGRTKAVRAPSSVHPVRPIPKREQIAAIVDEFLSRKIEAEPNDQPPASIVPEPADSPVKTVIHELRPQSLTENGASHQPVDFVSESDVRDAVSKGQKIYITAKTILTPSAKDLGEEKEIFAKV